MKSNEIENMKKTIKPQHINSLDSSNNPRLIGINYNGSSGLSNMSSLIKKQVISDELSLNSGDGSISNKIILDNFEELPESRN